MAKFLKIFEWTTIPATIIATVFTVLSFFSQPAITDCDGFLIYDPPANILATQTLPKREQKYLNSKLACYRDRIQNNPSDAEAYTNLGEVERRFGNLEEAAKAHHKALELHANLQEANIGLALVEADLEHHHSAYKWISKAINGSKKSIAYLYQGVILQKDKKDTEAQKAWQKAGSYEPLTPIWEKITNPTVIADWKVPFFSSKVAP